ncbi:hypothetical protein KP509_13G008100 [Ceratopteris richardii]|uniref:SAGA-associated factor 11 n=1 Tax=Ceratopteris richardii TaxID=49495 RepID=A0A8T2TGA4_CERRI|nr:hypothetical protein KP509_13G008100 [Ceratopteris richardii]KAH7420445.1 hypothetical protein KP509_13G008100 [Ceratopteris richardii]
MEDQLLAEQAESIFLDLLDSTIIDVASEAHRAARLGFDPRLSIDEEGEYNLAMQARVSVGDFGANISKKSQHGMVDMFGQTHPAVASEIFECMSCNRKIMAGRFAPHLERCMGKGRRARSTTVDNKKADKGDIKMFQESFENITDKRLKLEVPSMANAHENVLTTKVEMKNRDRSVESVHKM